MKTFYTLSDSKYQIVIPAFCIDFYTHWLDGMKWKITSKITYKFKPINITIYPKNETSVPNN